MSEVTVNPPVGVQEWVGKFRNPDWMYVSNLLMNLKWELQGAHRKYAEVAALVNYEESTGLPGREKKTNQEVHIGLAAELIESVKAAILAGEPRVTFTALRKTGDAEKNASAREHYWTEELEDMLGGDKKPNYIAELLESQLMGMGILKAAKSMSKWDVQARKKKRGETPAEHIDRVNALKRKWGHPISKVVVEPVAVYFRPGEGSEIIELVEHSYKAKKSVYENFDITTDKVIGPIPTSPGVPEPFVKSFPAGFDTSQYVLVTEYWNPMCYKVFFNGTEVYAETNQVPSVSYFFAPGRSSSSKDPDKFSLSIAENLRHNEPKINRLITRMLEGAELTVNKRNTLEVPEGYSPETEELEVPNDAGGTAMSAVPRSWTFEEGKVEALPAGAKLVDVYAGAEEVSKFLPVLQLLIQITNQHGLNPVMKGISPGAAGSGYRDNSLYLMAKSIFQYIISSLQGALTGYIEWAEDLLVNNIKQETWSGEYSLSPKDISDYPCEITVVLKPQLPQNLIAEGEFWTRQQQAGNVSRRYVREHGLDIEQPEEMEDETDLEQMMEMLKPYLMEDVIATVLGRGPMAGQQSSGIVNSQGEPISSNDTSPVPGGPRTTSGGASGANPNGSGGMGRDMGRSLGGFATQGQGKAPQTQPGAIPAGR